LAPIRQLVSAALMLSAVLARGPVMDGGP
jgi:hypothetical protein